MLPPVFRRPFLVEFKDNQILVTLINHNTACQRHMQNSRSFSTIQKGLKKHGQQ